MSNPITQVLVQQIECQVTDIALRSRIAGIAIAIAIANTRPLPTAEVVSPPAYYADQVAPQALTLIGRFNEDVVVDTRDCEAAVRTFWHLRYNAVNPRVVPSGLDSWSFFDSFFGADNLISEDDNKFLNQHRRCIFSLVLQASACIDHFKEGN